MTFKRPQGRHFVIAMLLLLLSGCVTTRPAIDPLPSWVDGTTRQSMVEFVEAVTDPGGDDYVPPSERVATFDNDGTLWSEKPTYFQFMFTLDRVKALAPSHPEWSTLQPFQAVLENDWAALQAAGHEDWAQLFVATHTGMSSDEFADIVDQWIETARHPRFDRAYTALVFQPMLELLDYLRANDFRVFIVSGGSVGFLRPWVEEVYGIAPEQVVGTVFETQYEIQDGSPVIIRKPEMHFVNDKAGKPIGIQRFIGRRPILAVGNSDGDYQMLQWTTSGEGRRLGLLVHHTDAEREWAYDRESTEGRLDKGLDDAAANGWGIIDMARDWKTVYAFERKPQ